MKNNFKNKYSILNIFKIQNQAIYVEIFKITYSNTFIQILCIFIWTYDKTQQYDFYFLTKNVVIHPCCLNLSLSRVPPTINGYSGTDVGIIAVSLSFLTILVREPLILFLTHCYQSISLSIKQTPPSHQNYT